MISSQHIKVKGFTLMELLVVLLLFSLIVSMGLIVANIVKTNFNTLSDVHSQLSTIQENDMELSAFFLNSDSIFYNAEDHSITSNKSGTISIDEGTIYNQTSNQILFDSIFDVKITWFKNQNNQNLVTCLFFSKNVNNIELPFTHCKLYDIKTRINYPMSDSLTIP